MSVHKRMPFFDASIDYLGVWAVGHVDPDKIKTINDDAGGRGCPFNMLVTTGEPEGVEGPALVDGGISLSVFGADRPQGLLKPVVTICMPWSSAKMMSEFLRSLPDYDPAEL